MHSSEGIVPWTVPPLTSPYEIKADGGGGPTPSSIMALARFVRSSARNVWTVLAQLTPCFSASRGGRPGLLGGVVSVLGTLRIIYVRIPLALQLVFVRSFVSCSRELRARYRKSFSRAGTTSSAADLSRNVTTIKK